jgi:hypothetical protein
MVFSLSIRLMKHGLPNKHYDTNFCGMGIHTHSIYFYLERGVGVFNGGYEFYFLLKYQSN